MGQPGSPISPPSATRYGAGMDMPPLPPPMVAMGGSPPAWAGSPPPAAPMGSPPLSAQSSQVFTGSISEQGVPGWLCVSASTALMCQGHAAAAFPPPL